MHLGDTGEGNYIMLLGDNMKDAIKTTATVIMRILYGFFILIFTLVILAVLFITFLHASIPGKDAMEKNYQKTKN